MKNQKKNSFLSHRLLFALIILKFIPIISQQEDISLDDLFNPTIEIDLNNLENQGITRANSCPTPEETLSNLVPPDGLVDVPSILKNNFYKHTNPPRVRSLTTLPIITTGKILIDKPFFFRPTLFVNHTPHMYYHSYSPFIDSYIDLENPNIIQQLDEQLNQIGFTQLRIPTILPLFQHIKLQETRAGIDLGITARNENWMVTVDLPVYYAVHNFFLTQNEQEAIKNCPLFSQAETDFCQSFEGDNLVNSNPSDTAAPNTDESVKDFLMRHLVNDKVGLGDTRIRLYYDLHRDKSSSDENMFLVGAWLILPTSYTFKQMVKFGGKFDKEEPLPQFSLQEFLNLIECNGGTPAGLKAATVMGRNFLEGVLNRLSANLIDLDMGNNQHIGTGPIFLINRKIYGPWRWQIRGEVEYDFKATETRFFLHAKNPAEFDRNYQDPSQAVANLNFLSRELVNFLYPDAVPVLIYPGTQLLLTTHLNGVWDHIETYFGYDFWWQAEEKAAVTPTTRFTCKQLQIKKGLKPHASQSKLFGFLGYHKNYPNGDDLQVGVASDWTILSSGIGKDFSIGIYLKMIF